MERRHAPEQCSQELLKQLTSQLRQSVDDARDVLREALEARTELTHQRNAATTSAEVRRSNDQASIELLGIAGASLSPIAAHEHVLNDVGTDAIFKLAERLSLPVERLGENLSLSNIQILVREGRKFSLEPHQADQLYRVAYVASLAADLPCETAGVVSARLISQSSCDFLLGQIPSALVSVR